MINKFKTVFLVFWMIATVVSFTLLYYLDIQNDKEINVYSFCDKIIIGDNVSKVDFSKINFELDTSIYYRESGIFNKFQCIIDVENNIIKNKKFILSFPIRINNPNGKYTIN